MASTNSTIDGMGGEEMNQVGIQPSNIMIAGSVVAGELGSFAGELYGDNIWGNSVNDTDGVFRSSAIENATELFGYRIKAGSIVTGNSASGLVHFKTSFSTANYFMFATPRELATPGFSTTGSQGRAYIVSGVYRASGCWLYGGSKTVVNWLAIGI